jgi:hypothetical protein
MLRRLDGGSVGPRRGALSPESMWFFGIEKWSTRLRFRIRRSLNSAGSYISGFGETLGLGLERPFRRAHVYISPFGPHFDLFFFTSSLHCCGSTPRTTTFCTLFRAYTSSFVLPPTHRWHASSHCRQDFARPDGSGFCGRLSGQDHSRPVWLPWPVLGGRPRHQAERTP